MAASPPSASAMSLATNQTTPRTGEIRRGDLPSPTSMSKNSSLALSSATLMSVSIGAKIERTDADHYRNAVGHYEEKLKALPKDIELKDLIFFPEDDIQVIQKKRHSRTVAPALPPTTPRGVATPRGTAAAAVKVDTMFKECHSEMTADLFIVERKYENHGGKRPVVSNGPLSSTPAWPETESLKHKTDNVPLLPHFISTDYKPEESRKRDKQDRQQNRREVFAGYAVTRQANDDHPSDPRLPGQPFAPKIPFRMMVTCKKFLPSLGNIEPFFASITIIDVVKGKKLTETFYFDINEDAFPNLGGAQAAVAEKILTKSGFFAISEPNPDLFVIIRVEKLLGPVEGDAIVEPYMKAAALKPKEKEKLTREIETSCKYLWKYRQGFAWSYYPLFNAEGGFLPTAGLQLPFTRMKSTHTDKEVCETIVKAIQKSKGNKKALLAPTFSKPIPGEFLFDFKTLKPEEEPPGRLDPSHLPVLPLAEGADQKNVIRELREFDIPKLVPHSEVVHDLYIYPESLNFSKHKDGKVKNISMAVCMKEKHREPLLKNLYEKGTQVKQHFHCTVSYNKKAPVFYDEIKIRLPVTIHDEEIRFNFYNVQCPVKHPDSPIEHEIGTAILPLYSDQNRILGDGLVQLPVIYDHKWLDSKKPLLNVQARLVSTLVAQEERLHSLMELYQLGVEQNFVSVALKEIGHIPDGLLMQFFAPLMKMTTTLLCKDDVANVAFLAMLHLLGVVARVSGEDKNSRVPILVSYANYHFHISEAKLFHHKLIKVWLSLIDQKFEGMNELGSFSWFLFELLAKSLALFLQAEGKLHGDRVGRVSTEFTADLTTFITWCANSVNQRIFGQDVTPLFNVHVAFLLKDLLALLDRGFVQSLIFDYVSILNPSNDKLAIVKDKFAFLRVIVDYEHFIPLNLPVKLEVTELLQSVWKVHFLIGLLLHEVGSCLGSPEAEIRARALSTVRDLLWKHDLDPRYQDLARKQRIAGLYFPLVLMVLEKIVQIRDSDKKDEKRDIMICFLFVVKNCDRNLFLRKWWSSDAPKNQLRFITALSTCLEVFEELTMSKEVSYIVLDILEDFMEDKEAELTQPSSALTEAVFNVLILLLRKDNCIPFILCLFATLCRFVHTHKKALFISRNTSFCGDLCYELLRYSNLDNGTARAAAGSILYLMMKTNLKETSNFSRMRLQLTVAMSKLCGEGNQKEYKNAQSTLDQTVAISTTESKGALESLVRHVEDIRAKLLKLIEDSLKIRIYDYDPEMTSDLYYQVSTFYFDSPDLRVAWLENLSCYQRDRNNWEEAAQCKLYIAALIAEYITTVNGKPREGIPSSRDLFKIVSPSISNELGLPPVDIHKAEEEGMYNTKTFSEEGFINHLTLAIRYLKRSSTFEACIDVYNLLVELYETHRDYVQLSSCFRDLKTICDAVCATEKVERILPSYYWIMFYGSNWGDFEGKSFIYKDPKGNTHVADILERFMKQFSAKFKIETMRVLQPKRGPIELDKLLPNFTYFHIEPVTEYFDQKELADRLTPWERKFNISRFLFEMPFTKSGKPSNDLLDQYKQKTILSVNKCFPYVNTRLEVIGKEKIIISPIETAIDVISKRTATVKALLAAKPVDIAALRAHLQECVSKGPVHSTEKVLRAFFNRNPSPATPTSPPTPTTPTTPTTSTTTTTTSSSSSIVSFPEEIVMTLQKHLSDLLAIVGVAIKLSKQLIGPEEQESQQKLEDDFNEVKKIWSEVQAANKAKQQQQLGGTPPVVEQQHPQPSSSSSPSTPVTPHITISS